MLNFTSEMRLKIAIIDDEKHACETLKWQLDKLDVAYESCVIFQDSVHAVEHLKQTPPDLIFLDIEMPGLNGFQFIEKLNLPEVNVVFTTAYGKFAADAFRVNAIDYLIKPIETTELKEAVDRVVAKNKTADSEKLKEVFAQIESSKASKTKIALPSVHGIEFMDCRDIIYCQSERNYTRIYLQDGSKKLASKTLKEIGRQLPESDFCRIHHSCIANLNKVTGYNHNDGGTLILNGTHELKISRSKKKELLVRLEGI